MARPRDHVNCTAHSDGTCRPHEYCAIYDGSGDDDWIRPHFWDAWCLACGSCFERGWPYGPPVDGSCPTKCNCTSSADCPSHNQQQQEQQLRATLIAIAGLAHVRLSDSRW
eukprot:CAMPEP_0178667406 /NCGR_PEP_ID=MMETSP0698-20121128/31025_1 /TAXON_ID=265572 /ORGANISM="Extubocellulus spinifer, Strain CCMP396" /LENGTH=110 /DNA_ID=CAMNT_0020310895 /DNA_START=265 /DNA_END=594 /DNA_ORIENTATION=+